MAKKKKIKKVIPKPSIGEDLPLVKLPFDLYNAFSTVIEELTNNNFEYEGATIETQSVLNFKSKEKNENVTITITNENLLIKCCIS